MALRRRTGTNDQPDILALLLRLQTEHGLETMSDVAILEMVRTLLVAGYETTASTLGWVAERVTRHPEVLARLDASSSQADDGYIDAVVTETMRLRPVAPFTSRLVVAPFELDGLGLPPGILVTPFIWLVHRRRDVYCDPELFVPERFIGRRPDTYAWIPFGGGLRKCLGGPLAMLEMRTVLRTMLEELRWVATDEPDETLGRRNVTIVPGGGATVILRRRLRASPKPTAVSAKRTEGRLIPHGQPVLMSGPVHDRQRAPEGVQSAGPRTVAATWTRSVRGR
jgi:cytochrome P450